MRQCIHVNHQILKSKTKELLKVLSSSGIRGTKFIYFDNFPAQQRPSLGNQRILNFRVMAMRDIKQHKAEMAFVNFVIIQVLKVLGKLLVQMFFGSFLISSRLDSQSKFQMFTDLYTIYRPPYWRAKVLQHGGSILGFIISRGTFRRISQLWDSAHLKLGELPSLFIVYNITIS